MKNRILLATFDMEVGGVERSLLNMLNDWDYERHNINLLLYRHQGAFMEFLSNQANLIKEIPEYATFRKSVKELVAEKNFKIAYTRVLAKWKAKQFAKASNFSDSGYLQMQLMWKYALPYLPQLNEEYDAAISYLWPHYFVAEKVKARKKIAWIHTDYSTIDTNIELDLEMWNKFDDIVAVSEACREAFLKKYKPLEAKVSVIENINSPDYVKKMAKEKVENQMMQDNRFKLCTVARLSHAKGIDQAVRALRILKDKGHDNIAWYVVGYGGDEGEIRRLINDLGVGDQFILLGKQINPYPYIKACDLYVQPSRYEGKAVTVTEAKILGKPVIITSYPTASSQIVDGVDGVIAELNPEGITKEIIRLINNKTLRQALINNTKNSNYSNIQELNRLYELCQEV
ncbi:glycosyltransferase [Peribacillus sp. SCS-37]|uniref:glycosyltransferase n=1 Tax=Paraperibacillus esterisolvens TaxID=3115296 RepID=UPI00390604BC